MTDADDGSNAGTRRYMSTSEIIGRIMRRTQDASLTALIVPAVIVSDHSTRQPSPNGLPFVVAAVTVYCATFAVMVTAAASTIATLPESYTVTVPDEGATKAPDR